MPGRVRVCPASFPVLHLCRHAALRLRARSRSVWHQPLLQRGQICVLPLIARVGVVATETPTGVIGLRCTHTHHTHARARSSTQPKNRGLA